MLGLGREESVGARQVCCGTETGSYLRRIDSYITQLEAQGPSTTYNESKEEEEEGGRCTCVMIGPSSILLQGPGFRVQGSGFRVQGPGSRVQCSGFRVQGPGFRVQGSGSRVLCSVFRVYGLWFRVQGLGPMAEGLEFSASFRCMVLGFVCRV